MDGILSERAKYVEDALEASIKSRDVERLKMRIEFEAREAGKSEERIRQLVEELQHSYQTAKRNAHGHLKASLETVELEPEMIRRLRDNF